MKRKLFYQTAQSSIHIRYQYVREDLHVKIYSFLISLVLNGVCYWLLISQMVPLGPSETENLPPQIVLAAKGLQSKQTRLLQALQRWLKTVTSGQITSHLGMGTEYFAIGTLNMRFSIHTYNERTEQDCIHPDALLKYLQILKLHNSFRLIL